MMRMTRGAPRLVAAVVIATAFAAGGEAVADWPDRPLTLMVPTSPGGSQDRFARTMAPFLEEELGQPIQIVNRGPSLVGHITYLNTADDGYTVLVSTPYPFRVVDVLLGRAPFEMEDFALINAQWVDYPILYVHKDSPWQTAAEFIDAVIAQPGRITTGVVPNSVGHVMTVKLSADLGLGRNGMRIVTYEGGGPKRAAFAGNQIDFGIEPAEGTASIREFLRPLAVFLDERSPDYPDVPTINEVLEPHGVTMPSVNYQFLSLLVSRAFRETYPDRWDVLVEANRRLLAREDVRAALREREIGADWRGPEATRELLARDTAFLAEYVDLLARGGN